MTVFVKNLSKLSQRRTEGSGKSLTGGFKAESMVEKKTRFIPVFSDQIREVLALSCPLEPW